MFGCEIKNKVFMRASKNVVFGDSDIVSLYCNDGKCLFCKLDIFECVRPVFEASLAPL